MKSNLALVAAALPAAGAFVLPTTGWLSGSSSSSSSTTTTTTRLAPLQVKSDFNWFERVTSGAGEGDKGDAPLPSANRYVKAAAGNTDFRVALRDALWEVDDRIHGMLPYDEAAAEADPMYFLNGLKDRLTELSKKEAPVSSKDMALMTSSVQDMLAKTQFGASAVQDQLRAVVEEGMKTVNSAGASAGVAFAEQASSVLTSSSPPSPPRAPKPEDKKAAAAMSPPASTLASAAMATPPPVKKTVVKPTDVAAAAPAVVQAAAAAVVEPNKKVEEASPPTTLQYRNEPRVARTRSKRWVEERWTRSAARQQAKAPPAPVVKPVTGGGGGGGGKPPRRRRDAERAEEQLRKKKAQEIRLQRQKQQVIASMPATVVPPVMPKVVEAKVVQEEKKKLAFEPVAKAEAAPPKPQAIIEVEPKLQVPPPVAEKVEALAAASATNIKRMTTGADRARELAKETMMVSAPSATTTVQEAMKQAAAKAAPAAASPKVPEPLAASMTPPSPTLKGAADADVNPMPPLDRKSVENILRDSKMAAVEEWHRTRSVEKEMSLEEKVALVESRLVEEIQAGPSEAITNYVKVLEKIGEHQAAPGTLGAPSATGRWDLAYSSTTIAPFFFLPRFLARFLVSISAKVEGKVVVYRTIFKLFEWFPRLRRTQKATLNAITPRKTVEVLSGRPRYALGRLVSFVQPRLPSFRRKGTPAPKEPEAPKLVNTCTYLGSQLKICRLSTPSVEAEPLVTVFVRGKGAAAADEEEMLVLGDAAALAQEPLLRSPAISQLFKRFDKKRARMA